MMVIDDNNGINDDVRRRAALPVA